MEATRVKSRLENQKQIKADAVWISDCIKFIKQSTQVISDDRLVETVLSHFLTTDFNESKCNESMLPVGVSELMNEFVSGQFILQIDEVVNIGESIFQQRLQQVDQLQRPDNFPQFIDSKNRTLKFNLTDGVQRVFAFEYKPVPQIHNKVSPGCKIRVRDVWVRRGMLLFTPESVEILGGQSQSLLSAQQEYLEKFKQTNGRMDNSTNNPPNINNNASSNNNNANNTNNAPNVPQNKPFVSVKASNPPVKATTKPPVPVTQPISISDDESDKSDHSNVPNMYQKNIGNTQPPDLPLDNDEDDFDDDFMREIDLVEQAVSRDKSDQRTSNQLAPMDPMDVPDIEDDLDFLSQTSRPTPTVDTPTDTKWQAKVNNMNTSFVSNISSVDLRQTFSYLRDVLLMPPNSETFLRVKAAVVNTVPPFSFTKRFSLDVKIDDGTETMIVILGDAVIRQILGITCEQFNDNIRSEAGKQDNQRRLKVMEQSLIGLEGVMTLELQAHSTKPTVIDIAAPTLQDISSFYSEIMHGYGMDSVNNSTLSSTTASSGRLSNIQSRDEIDELLDQVDDDFEY